MHPVRHLLLAALLVSACATVWGEACVKTVRWFEDAPYAYQGADGEMRGFDVDIARSVLAQIGCQAQWVQMPWARALVELKAGRLDVLPGAFRRPEREVYAYFSRPVNRSRNVLFVRRAVQHQYAIRKLSDLVGTDFRLGAQTDVSYGPSYDTLLGKPEFKARITPVNAARNAWQMMERGRLDGLISEEISGLMDLQNLGLQGVVAKSPVVVSDEPSRFAFSRQSTDAAFVRAFDQALNAMLADGRYRDIAQRYLPCPVSVEKLGCK